MKVQVNIKFLINLFLFFIFTLFFLNIRLINELYIIYSNRDNKSTQLNAILNEKNYIRSWIIKPSCRCLNNSIKINEYVNFYSIYSVKYQKNDLLHKILKNEINFRTLSCSDYHSLKNGPRQKIISYSLYGKNRKYYHNFDSLAEQIKKFYGLEWKIRIYHDNSIDESIICKYECKYPNQIQFCSINEIKYFNFASYSGIYWRWIPLMDNLVDYIQSRDLDSWIIEREYKATSEWLSSKFSFHVIRDHPFHFFPILAGLWSFAINRNRSLSWQIFSKLINSTIIRPYNNHIYLEDQYFLVHHVWPLVQHQSLFHDSYFCTEFANNGLVKAFPTQRPDTGCFVSCSNCCQDKPNKVDLKLGLKSVGRMCPVQCRYDKNWDYC